jgi:hypothetical protein
VVKEWCVNTLDLKFFGVQAANLVENTPLLKCVYTPLLYARQAKTLGSGAEKLRVKHYSIRTEHQLKGAVHILSMTYLHNVDNKVIVLDAVYDPILPLLHAVPITSR